MKTNFEGGDTVIDCLLKLIFSPSYEIIKTMEKISQTDSPGNNEIVSATIKSY